MKEVITIGNVSGYVAKDSTAWLNAEDVARGWGFVDVKNGVEYVRWNTLNRYLTEFGFSQHVAKGDFLPENMVYRLGFKANNERAQAFQAKLADEVLPAIRKTGGYQAKQPDNSLQSKRLDIMDRNSRARAAKLLLKIAERTSIKEYKEVCNAKAAAMVTGEEVLPMPEAGRRTYSAKEIGKMFGVSANRIGKLANAHKLKTPEYGKLFYSKSEHSVKEVETWRYYKTAIPVFAGIFGIKAVAV
jgi:hypothetical protein